MSEESIPKSEVEMFIASYAGAYADEIAALKAKLAECRAALEPFRRAYDLLQGGFGTGRYISNATLREAHEVLAKWEGDDGKLENR